MSRGGNNSHPLPHFRLSTSNAGRHFTDAKLNNFALAQREAGRRREIARRGKKMQMHVSEV